MASLRDIRRKIKSVKATEQIMATMKMVAAARIKKAQNAILNSRPFAVKMQDMVNHLHCEIEETDISNAAVYDFFKPQSDNAVGLIVVSSDKGLCGAFNANLFRTLVPWLREHKDKKIYAFAVGKKSRDFLRRFKGLDLEVIHQTVGIFPKAGYVHAELLGQAVMDSYRNLKLGKAVVIYNEFKSMISQKPVVHPLLPFTHQLCELSKNSEKYHNFIFEPEKISFFSALIPRYIKAQLYKILLESQAAELSARMNAMESASKNARDIIGELTLQLNRTRQAMITKELSEIVGGAQVLQE